MKNYRLTQRGKIVFTGLFIAIIIALVSMVSHLNDKVDPVGKELTINTEERQNDEETFEEIDEVPLESNKEAEDQGLETSENTSNELETESEAEEKETLGQESEDKFISKELEILYTLYYGPDKIYLDDKAKKILDNYYEFAKKNNSGIIIEGNYHNGIGYDEKMFEYLSFERALNVKEYLIKKGVDESRISIIDNKDSKPLNKDASDFEVGLNRRVDLYFEKYYKEVK